MTTKYEQLSTRLPSCSWSWRWVAALLPCAGVKTVMIDLCLSRMSTRCCTASFPYSQTVQAADSFHFLEKWYVARKHKVIRFFSAILFDTEVMSFPVFVILQLWTTLLPCLDTRVVLVWSSRCYGGLGLLMGLIFSVCWYSSWAGSEVIFISFKPWKRVKY